MYDIDSANSGHELSSWYDLKPILTYILSDTGVQRSTSDEALGQFYGKAIGKR